MTWKTSYPPEDARVALMNEIVWLTTFGTGQSLDVKQWQKQMEIGEEE